MAGRYTHAKQFRRRQRQLRILRSQLGRIIGDIRRKIEGQAVPENTFALPLSRASQIRSQQRQRGFKLYSFHAPEVECQSSRALLVNGMDHARSQRKGRAPAREGAQTMSHTNIVTIGSDLGKNTFHVVGFDAKGAIILRKKRSRN